MQIVLSRQQFCIFRITNPTYGKELNTDFPKELLAIAKHIKSQKRSKFKILFMTI
jgi:ferredoxin-fold anticodon binding domain-containing protein